MKPSDVLKVRRAAILELVGKFRVANPRVFGSTSHGSDHEGSDLDLLVDKVPGTTLFDLGGLRDELEELLGLKVEVRTPGDLPPSFRSKVISEAVPV